MTPLQRILTAYRATSRTEREKGTYFEELIRTYFRYEATYADLYDDVWLYSDWAKTQGLDAVVVTAGAFATQEQLERDPALAAKVLTLDFSNTVLFCEEARKKLLAGTTGYDVVVPSASFLERQIKAGVFMKLDRAKLPNLVNMDPEIMQRVALHDPGNEHSVPYLWGTTGIGYNPDKVKAALGVDTIDSWSVIFDPANAAKLKDCGLVMLDAPTEAVYKFNPREYSQATAMSPSLTELTINRPLRRIFAGSFQVAREPSSAASGKSPVPASAARACRLDRRLRSALASVPQNEAHSPGSFS